MAKKNNTQNGMSLLKIISVVVIVLVLVGVGLWVYKAKFTPKPKPVVKTQVMRRSTPLGKILGVVVASSIDPKTGKPVNLATTFAKNTKNIYLILQLDPKKTAKRIEYIAYLVRPAKKNLALTHKSIPVTAGAQYATVTLSLANATAMRMPGTYLYKFYTDGKLERTVYYTITNTLATGFLAQQ